MDVAEYRKRTTDELEAGAAASDDDVSPDADAALGTLLDRGRPDAERIAALGTLGRRIDARPDLIDRMIEVVRDATESAGLRLAAIEALQSAAFLVPVFAPRRPAYHEALRSMIDDADPKLRRRALGILARSKDEYAQRRLIEGLKHPSKARVPAAKAIQFLGYDVHAEYFPLIRRIVEKPPTTAAKREGIRLLAADPKSRPMLARIMRDRNESRDIRRMSAVALQSVAPTRFQGIARKIALDESEDDRLRATSLSGLAQFASPESSPAQRTFTRRVTKLREKTASPDMKRASKSYIDKLSK